MTPEMTVSSRLVRGIATWLDLLRRNDAARAQEVEQDLSQSLWVCGRDKLLDWTQAEVDQVYEDFAAGILTPSERTSQVTSLWMDASDRVYDLLLAEIRNDNPVYMMSDSGARGGKRQTTQLSGMRGLMSDPHGRLIESLPIRSSFREGLSLHEYFITTHGARKGLADTALRTADAGYLTRRMVDVAQDVIVREADCGTTNGIEVETVWENPRRCPSSDAPILHLGSHSKEASAMLAQLAEVLGAEQDVRHDGQIPYVHAIRPKKASDAEKYARLDQGQRIGDLLVDRNYRFEVDTREDASGERSRWITVKSLSVEKHFVVPLDERLAGRTCLDPIYHPLTGELLVDADEFISDGMAKHLAYDLLLEKIKIRSPATCDCRRGICAKCYGRDLASKSSVVVGEAVGIIAAQSIGEPGTQLTMRTFHTGGVVAGPEVTGDKYVKRRKMEAMRQLMDDLSAGEFDEQDLGSGERERNRAIQQMLKVLENANGGLVRVVELFEARRPKGEAITTDVDGSVDHVRTEGLKKVVILSEQPINADPACFKGATAAEAVVSGRRTLIKEGAPITAKMRQTLQEAGHSHVKIRKEYLLPPRFAPAVRQGDQIQAGDRLTPGPLDPGAVLDFKGVKGIIGYVVEEIQKVYRSQGVGINDKHIEIIVRQMLRKREVVEGGDTDLLPGQKIDRAVFDEENERVVREGGRAAVSRFCLLGITEASLATESFLSAASFQKTTRVLTEAAVQGKEDRLMGLKENVIIGRLIPAGTGMDTYQGTGFEYGDVSREDLGAAATRSRTASEEEEEEELALDRSELDAVRRDGFDAGFEEPDDLEGDELDEDDDDDQLCCDVAGTVSSVTDREVVVTDASGVAHRYPLGQREAIVQLGEQVEDGQSIALTATLPDGGSLPTEDDFEDDELSSGGFQEEVTLGDEE
ncbi:MAG: hypothetical protein IT204_21060 [Fimbriimonadaceae bacterium]|nr:hypothetical protein [Fimbriimonadaceae bacterium]